ncbi:Phosphoglucomutase-2 [Nosema bombycis CQ1]|uniref:Phosphoglucomutase-2 n=1 Tax=Nosema bombycis (strain CQ1 / CVCC 102059) TaxID=578461 RepID=R0M3R3_NOSB1|nr:Phosphoglucomutase-2 [Nosema bombycis CQ1]|eukprot:EOB12664.1 Phosphoglucomutase-2 [Nosema bombycis CQ1]
MNLKEQYNKLTKNKDKFNLDLEKYGDKIVTQRLKFTTGGMRGLMREGFNGINEVTCNILCTALAKRFNSVTIGYDSRNKSSNFGMIASKIFRKHGKSASVFDHMATPSLSHLIGVLGTDIGLMITASHNPKEYNGFKVYDKNGCQITSPLDEEIASQLLNNEITDLTDTNPPCDNKSVMSRDEAVSHYIKNLFRGWNSNQIPFLKSQLKVLFTPLYGVSIDFVRLGIKEYGFLPSFDFFEKHCCYDPSFPGLPFPNPEVDQVYDEPKKLNYDLIFSCDPDGDRFGMIEKQINGDYVHYSGDEIASIFIKYFIDNFEHSSLVFINTFLCNDFMEDVSARFKIEYHRTKTGFKNVSKVINEVFQRGEDKFIFAYEDSLGFFFGGGREKDGIKCVLLMAHILQGTKPSKILSSLQEYGTYSTFNFHFRCEDPDKILDLVTKSLECKKLHDMFIMDEEDYKMILRKSGTEPIIKIYCSSKFLKKKILKEKVMDFVNENFKK